jgi:hypothetical protein
MVSATVNAAPQSPGQCFVSPEDVLARHLAASATHPAPIDTAIAIVAGFFTHQVLQPAPPGLPTLRRFQAAQGEVARAWLRDAWA